MFLIVSAILWVASIFAGWRIMRWKDRFACLFVCVVLGPLGVWFALMMDAQCPHCRGFMSMAADVCPHCGRNRRDGKVTVRR